jgi:hypothetical protein
MKEEATSVRSLFTAAAADMRKSVMEQAATEQQELEKTLDKDKQDK